MDREEDIIGEFGLFLGICIQKLWWVGGVAINIIGETKFVCQCISSEAK